MLVSNNEIPPMINLVKLDETYSGTSPKTKYTARPRDQTVL